jgi:hypothetical protein
MWSTLAVFLVLAPNPAPAQTVSTSFEELRQVLKKGQTVVVTDATGQRTKGKVGDLSPSSLVVLVPEARTFTKLTVSEIRVTDPVSNGALIGAAIGTGFATGDYLIDPSEPGNAVVFAEQRNREKRSALLLRCSVLIRSLRPLRYLVFGRKIT